MAHKDGHVEVVRTFPKRGKVLADEAKAKADAADAKANAIDARVDGLERALEAIVIVLDDFEARIEALEK